MTDLLFATNRRTSPISPQLPAAPALNGLPTDLLRTEALPIPNIGELQVVRHFTQLSQRNFAIDTHFYPLGSCTMKYNPKVAHVIASFPGFLNRHPYAPDSHSQGYLACAYELQQILMEVTGMAGVSLSCLAGAQGEFAGVSMIKAYHHSRGDQDRTEIIVPDAAHGTNPASAVIAGFRVREVATTASGDIDLAALAEVVSAKTAAIMLTNPSTLGVFERCIEQVAALVHNAGGLLYYDGANFNAILGKVRPGEMGFDVMHLNLHKTFATPHGGGGPGAGPVACGEHLRPFLPRPIVIEEQGSYRLQTAEETPASIGQLATFAANAGINLRAYCYARLLGREGMQRVSSFATLNANYLMKCLQLAGFTIAFPERRASHEFILTFKTEQKNYAVSAMDVAKRLLDYGFHAPTTYFPLLIPECFLIEPTETESKETLDNFITALIAIREEIQLKPETVQTAPHTLATSRLDDVRCAKELDVCAPLQSSDHV